jgi:hypothetical protein
MSICRSSQRESLTDMNPQFSLINQLGTLLQNLGLRLLG